MTQRERGLGIAAASEGGALCAHSSDPDPKPRRFAAVVKHFVTLTLGSPPTPTPLPVAVATASQGLA